MGHKKLTRFSHCLLSLVLHRGFVIQCAMLVCIKNNNGPPITEPCGAPLAV